MEFLIVIAVLFFIGLSYIPGYIACALVGDKNKSVVKCVAIGIASGLISGAFSSFLYIDEIGLNIIVYIASLIGIAYIFRIENTTDEQVDDGNKTHKAVVAKTTMKQESEMQMSNLDYKNLIRIPVWALYSLIMATVIISVVIVINIWVPEAIDEEIIWKIVITYGVFLVGALVIFNITDKIKEMNNYKEKK